MINKSLFLTCLLVVTSAVNAQAWNGKTREGENTISVMSGQLSDECRCTLNSNGNKEQTAKEEQLDGAVN